MLRQAKEANMAKKTLLDHLAEMGFDRCKAIPFEEGARVGCSQCAVCCINGVACHETGCRNEARARRARAHEDDEDCE